MISFSGRPRVIAYLALMTITTASAPVLAEPAESDVCVVGKHKRGIGQTYYQHNEVVVGDYRELMRTFEIAEMRGAENAETMIGRMRAALEATPHIDRKMYGVVIEPPTYVDHNRSCGRFSEPPVENEYPVVFNTTSPRLIGRMCTQEPEIRFDIGPTRPVALGVMIELDEFYDPKLSAESPLSYAALSQRADKGDRLASLIRGIMGVRMTQCSNLPASMKLVAVRNKESIMTASLLFLDDGIQLLTRDDETGRRLANMQMRAKEQLRRRLERSANWEEKAAVGAAVVLSGLAIMMMNQCNDIGSMNPKPWLEDCE
ncbi:hypothetical protein [Allohahella marinimesophila]